MHAIRGSALDEVGREPNMRIWKFDAQRRYVLLNTDAGGTPSRCNATTHCCDTGCGVVAMKTEHDTLA